MPTAAPPTETLTARALVAHDGGQLDTLTIPVPALQPGEVLVRMNVATVCGCVTDVLTERRLGAQPTVLGHEGVGVIEATGRGKAAVDADGTMLAPGMRVVWGRNAGCQRCPGCLAGAGCRTPVVLGEEPADAALALAGSLATHAVLPTTAVIGRVPAGLPDSIAAPAGCAVASVCAVIEAAGSVAGRRVTVIGAGMQGLVAVAMLAEEGAASITIIDPTPQRRQRALEFGADAALDPHAGFSGSDVVLDVSGGADTLTAASESLDRDGVLVVGRTRSQVARMHLDIARLSRRSLSVRGAPSVGARHVLQALDFLAATHAARPWGTLIASPVPLDDIDQDLPVATGRHARALVSLA